MAYKVNFSASAAWHNLRSSAKSSPLVLQMFGEYISLFATLPTRLTRLLIPASFQVHVYHRHSHCHCFVWNLFLVYVSIEAILDGLKFVREREMFWPNEFSVKKTNFFFQFQNFSAKTEFSTKLKGIKNIIVLTNIVKS